MQSSKNDCQTPLSFFLKQVKHIPSEKAIVCQEKSLTFSELDLLSGKIANFMLAKGVNRGNPIGLLVNKDIRMMATILAAWKIGCPYVPIDIEFPEKRIKYILEVCDIRFVVVEGKYFSNYSENLLKNQYAIVLDVNPIDLGPSKVSWGTILQYPSLPIDNIQKPDDLSYIIFTSGSTGQPKGVMITGKNLAHFIQWCVTTLDIKKNSRALNIAKISFDQSVMDIAFMIGCGVELHLYDSIKHPVVLSDYIQKKNIQIFSTVPTIYGMLFDERYKLTPAMFSSLEKLFIGGAACPPSYLPLFHKYMQGAEVYNMYGPTEVTVYCFFKKFSQKELEKGVKNVSIGNPLPNHYAYLIEDKQRVTSEKGELIVHGPQVMKGYWKDGNFSDDVFIKKSGYKYKGYRTGDIVKKDRHGNFFFIGRTNEIIKCGGYRINLGEIETTIMNINAVENVAVVPLKDKLLENIIVAFIIPKSQHKLSEQNVCITCKESLPQYMIPQKIVFVRSLPLMTSGKIDKRQLKSKAEKLFRQKVTAQ